MVPVTAGASAVPRVSQLRKPVRMLPLYKYTATTSTTTNFLTIIIDMTANTTIIDNTIVLESRPVLPRFTDPLAALDSRKGSKG
ncbi:hypothetical protein E2C01_011368 [Portunus trituberculatus]|uniref:Uncharacterized protein n=1 Tax=Portunus trituberculatus TaxID=210409 RepID=A0A5B7DB04_PORTR|nr:hypothetical protein [Portunus trituberculatus]